LIPYPIAPLQDIVVLVTRPAAQALKLCEQIRKYGGEAIAFPTIVIESTATASPVETYDWLIFTSANAVQHGLSLVTLGEHTRVAAIGKATAAALAEREIRVDAMPQGKATSETLLNHPAFATVATQSVLIVKGVGGRELLQDELTRRGARVNALEVYRRAMPQLDAASVAQIEQRWRPNNPSGNDVGIDIVTLTSIETLDNLLAMLTDMGRALLKSTPFVTPSQRIADAARANLLQGQCVLSRGADDEALIGAIAAWHARAR
jgi:uroporphyrinogen-III synthase